MNATWRRALRQAAISLSRFGGSWLMALLLLVVVVPSACLLWFMNQAVQNERLAVRQRLVDAYRGHLALAQERVLNHWQMAESELAAQMDKVPAPILFDREVRAGAADALIFFDAAGRIVYPDATPSSPPQPADSALDQAGRLELRDDAAAARAFAEIAARTTNINVAARALQGQTRCLVRAGNEPAAIAILTGPLRESRYAPAADGQGRLIVPNSELMALELLKDSSSAQARDLFEHLRNRLLDYGGPPMPAPQRRFLMHELQRRFPKDTVFPTAAAEELAARFVEAGLTNRAEAGFRPTALPDVWQLPAAGGRAIALHRTTNLLNRIRAAAVLPDLPSDVRLDIITPGVEPEHALWSVPAGPQLPGWRLALSMADQRSFDAASRQRVSTYLWIGALAVMVILLLAALVLGLIRRQVALTQLRNDLVANVTHELKTPLSSMRLLVETLLDAPRLEESTARDYLRLIATENLRLSRLIENFLTFSRIERNRHRFEFKDVPAGKIAEDAAASVRERFHAPGCRFEVNVAPQLPSVLADTGAMVTVLVNLLDNAFKYTGDAKEITLTAGAENGGVFFSVKDNGIGLSSRETKRIFKRFYQVKEHRSHATGGCGLGLSIVQFIVSAHHGSVRVDSQPDRGSTFVVRLPAAGSPGATGNQP